MDAINQLIEQYGLVVFDATMREVVFERWLVLVVGLVFLGIGIGFSVWGSKLRKARYGDDCWFPFLFGCICYIVATPMFVIAWRMFVNPVYYVIKKLI